MNDSQILSTFQESRLRPDTTSATRGMPVRVFDACHVGVILRAVLFVEAVTGVTTVFGATDFWHWLGRMSVVTGGVLPATLVWLVAACSLKQSLARLSLPVQYAAGTAMGALAGVYGCGLLALTGFVDPPPWIASALAGSLLASQMVAALIWRSRARAPADAAARLTELQTRIRPHFLFNTLNTAIALVRDEPARTETVLEDLAELFRHALADRGEAVTLAHEIELARRYLEIEEARFGQRLRVEWVVDERAGQALLPPLLLQPLVENAVKHGVEPSASGADLRIVTQRRGDRVVIKVTNTVPGGQGGTGHGMALDNVRERLTLLHDLNGSFRSMFKDGLYQARIEVPA